MQYALTYFGHGVVRLPAAGAFQTGTRAIADLAVARLALAHGDFDVVPVTPGAPALVVVPAVATAVPAVAQTPVAAVATATPAPVPAPPRPPMSARRAAKR